MSATMLPAAPVGAPASPVLKGLAAGLAAALLWGLYLALSRAGVVGGLAAIDIAVIRYGVAGLVTLPLFAARGLPLARRIGWWRAVRWRCWPARPSCWRAWAATPSPRSHTVR